MTGAPQTITGLWWIFHKQQGKPSASTNSSRLVLSRRCRVLQPAWGSRALFVARLPSRDRVPLRLSSGSSFPEPVGIRPLSLSSFVQSCLSSQMSCRNLKHPPNSCHYQLLSQTALTIRKRTGASTCQF